MLTPWPEVRRAHECLLTHDKKHTWKWLDCRKREMKAQFILEKKEGGNKVLWNNSGFYPAERKERRTWIIWRGGKMCNRKQQRCLKASWSCRCITIFQKATVALCVCVCVCLLSFRALLRLCEVVGSLFCVHAALCSLCFFSFPFCYLPGYLPTVTPCRLKWHPLLLLPSFPLPSSCLSPESFYLVRDINISLCFSCFSFKAQNLTFPTFPVCPISNNSALSLYLSLSRPCTFLPCFDFSLCPWWSLCVLGVTL